MSVRRVIGGFGRGLILLGVIILLFVVYQLWGTGLAEARAQDRLQDEFAHALAATTTTTAVPPTTAAPAPAPTTTTTVLRSLAPPPPEGTAVAMLRIPRIGLQKAVVEGVGVGDLKKGPGHYPRTPMPGQPGNAAIAGHRTTYGAPFHRLDELVPGDEIFVTTLQGGFKYVVTGATVVSPGAAEVLDDTPDNRLTLTTCHPKYSARQRLIVVAELQGEAAVDTIDQSLAPVGGDVDGDLDGGGNGDVDDRDHEGGGLAGEDLGAGGADGEGAGPGVDRDPSTVTSLPTEPAGAFDEAGLSGDASARTPAILWGLLAAAVLAGEWAAARFWRRWTSYLAITPVFLVVLFFFFESFARLLPANI